jgi:hypothetical protein
MDNLLDLLPPSKSFTVEGHTFSLTALRVKDYAVMSAHLLETRPRLEEVLPKILAACPDQETKNHVAGAAFVKALRGHCVPHEEVMEWIALTHEGRAWSWWLGMKHGTPDMTLEQAETILAHLDERDRREAQRIKDAVPETPLGNSPGPGAENDAPGPGEKSSASSEKNSDGIAMSSAT